MRIPLDLYRILGIPQQTTEELIEQAYQDRIAQLPRREFSDEAIAVRNELLAIAYEELSDPDRRQAYDHRWWGDTTTDAAPLPVTQPEFDCEASQLIGILLILLDLGEYELVLEYGEPALNDSLDTVGETPCRSDYLLCVTLAHWELSREYWQQQCYELAATASLKAFARLQQENAFPDLQTTIRQELYKLRPYRILELLTQLPTAPESDEPLSSAPSVPSLPHRQKGLDLLRDTIQDRGGIEGNGQDHSGLANDDFLKFVHQLRPHLTIDEQAAVFHPESQRPSRIASYLAIHTLIAQGVRDKLPHHIVTAKSLIAQLANCQDLALENAICDLLLGQTENLFLSLDVVQDPKLIAAIGAGSTLTDADHDEVLLAFYGFAETWLLEEILPYFQGLTPDSLALSAYFDDPSVQHQLDNLSTDDFPPLDLSPPPNPLPSPNSEPETPMVHSSAAYADDYPPLPSSHRRGRGQRRSLNHVRAAHATNAPQGGTATLTPPAYSNGNGGTIAGNYYGTPSAPESLSSVPSDHFSNAVQDSSVPLTRRRRRKKRVKINPIRFGAFLLCLAGVMAGSAFLVFRGVSPLNSLEAEQLDITLNNGSELIPDESTQKSLLLSQPNFTQAVGQQVLQTWLDQKKVAFGEKHDLAALNTILVPSLLTQQQNRIKQDLAQNRYRQYEHQFKILNYTVNPRDPNQATVTARVQEITQLRPQGTTQTAGSSEKDDLTVKYQLVRQQGVWKIAQIQVVTVH
ncbi:MAG: IMS domain-containing protein [Synechocystis sp.]|nr:IMS domain-containing protein [Synechocystis sp.]